MGILDRLRPTQGAYKSSDWNVLPFDDTVRPAAAKSSLVQWEGDLSNFDAWRNYYDGATPELRRDAWGLAQAFAACEWVMRCVTVRASKAADLLNECDLMTPQGKTIKGGGEFRDVLEESFQLYKRDVWLGWARSITLWGEAYIERVYRYPNPANREVRLPGTFRVLNTLAVTPQIYAGKVQWIQYNDGVTTQQLPIKDVIMDILFNPFDDLRGMSMIGAALESVNTDQYIVAYTKSFFKNNTQFGNTYSFKEGYTPQPTDWERIKASVKEARGPDKAFNNVFIPAAVEVTPPTVPDFDPYDTMQDWQKRRICTAAGVPVALVDFGDARFQLSDEQRKGFYEETVVPDCRRLIRIANADMLGWLGLDGYRLELNTESIKPLLEDEEKGANIARADLAAGAITLNQYRALREQPALPNGDVLLLPAGVIAVPLEQLARIGQLTAPAPAPTPTPQTPLPAVEPEPPAEDVVTLPAEAVRTKQQTPEDELKAWRRFALRHGASKSAGRFQTYQIPDHIDTWVRDELLEDSSINAVFDDALMLIVPHTRKAWEDTRSAFVTEMVHIIGGGAGDELSRQAFSGQMRSALRRYGLMAFRDGMVAEGYNPESFSADELASFRAWQAESSAYVTGIGEEFFQGAGISAEQVPLRAEMWADKSLREIYFRGALIAAPNKLKRWRRNPAKDSCVDCIQRDGQVRAFRDWEQVGLPGSSQLACFGARCGCELIDA